MQLDLQQIIQGLKKRWWLVLIVALTAAAVAYIASDVQPRLYQAQVTVAALSVPLDNGNVEAIKKQLPINADQMASPIFVRDVVDGRYGEPIADVDPSAVALKTQAIPDRQSIIMTVDHADGLVAAQVAEAVSNAFITLQTAENQQANAGGYRVQWVVTQPAFEPTEPYQPRPRLFGAAAGLFGLLLGLLLAVGLELLDRTLKTTADVEKYVGVNTIGVIPRGKS